MRRQGGGKRRQEGVRKPTLLMMRPDPRPSQARHQLISPTRIQSPFNPRPLPAFPTQAGHQSSKPTSITSPSNPYTITPATTRTIIPSPDQLDHYPDQTINLQPKDLMWRWCGLGGRPHSPVKANHAVTTNSGRSGRGLTTIAKRVPRGIPFHHHHPPFGTPWHRCHMDITPFFQATCVVSCHHQHHHGPLGLGWCSLSTSSLGLSAQFVKSLLLTLVRVWVPT